jgi:hypothetical protein
LKLRHSRFQIPTLRPELRQYQPIKLVSISDWGRAVEVRREGDRDSVGFRKEALYRFEPGLFDKLRAAFHDDDRKSLMRLWNTAEHYG